MLSKQLLTKFLMLLFSDHSWMPKTEGFTLTAKCWHFYVKVQLRVDICFHLCNARPLDDVPAANGKMTQCFPSKLVMVEVKDILNRKGLCTIKMAFLSDRNCVVLKKSHLIQNLQIMMPNPGWAGSHPLEPGTHNHATDSTGVAQDSLTTSDTRSRQRVRCDLVQPAMRFSGLC